MSAVKLNLGCGTKLWPGFVNVDLPANHWGVKPDVEADLRQLPFADEYADEVHAIHVVEHFYLWEVVDLLREWRRVLKPGGLLAVEVPCMDKILLRFQDPRVDLRKTWLGLYGEQDSKVPAMTHRWCYSMDQLRAVLKKAGFRDVVLLEPQYHLKDRDMRVEGIK